MNIHVHYYLRRVGGHGYSSLFVCYPRRAWAATGIVVCIALYDVARPENMSPAAFIDTDDAPPPGYDVVCKEHMQSPEYETEPLALAGKRTH